MKRFLSVTLAAVVLSVGACAPLTTAVNTVCTDIAKMPPAAVAVLDAQDPHAAVGVLWADAKAACVAGVPVVGVDASWTGTVWGELKVLIPQVVPALIPLLIGLL
jgi:hypothetical protein